MGNKSPWICFGLGVVLLVGLAITVGYVSDSEQRNGQHNYGIRIADVSGDDVTSIVSGNLLLDHEYGVACIDFEYSLQTNCTLGAITLNAPASSAVVTAIALSTATAARNGTVGYSAARTTYRCASVSAAQMKAILRVPANSYVEASMVNEPCASLVYRQYLTSYSLDNQFDPDDAEAPDPDYTTDDSFLGSENFKY